MNIIVTLVIRIKNSAFVRYVNLKAIRCTTYMTFSHLIVRIYIFHNDVLDIIIMVTRYIIFIIDVHRIYSGCYISLMFYIEQCIIKTTDVVTMIHNLCIIIFCTEYIIITVTYP